MGYSRSLTNWPPGRAVRDGPGFPRVWIPNAEKTAVISSICPAATSDFAGCCRAGERGLKPPREAPAFFEESVIAKYL
jgi:hypothetical protein